VLRVISFNLNGIRSATRKGFVPWLARQRADIVCLQELRATRAQWPAEVTRLRSWHRAQVDAEKAGYSGVAIWSRAEPDRVVEAMGYGPTDKEGRYLRADFGQLSVVSLYFPSGSHSDSRQAFKMRALARIRSHLDELAASGRDCLVCGDVNIAHKKIDIENWRGNQKNSGFLPEERAWMDALLDSGRWTDAFRVVNQQPKQYTWWSNRGRAREKNVGWRIDYQLATTALGRRAVATRIYRRQRLSDHAPLIIDYDYPQQ